MFFGTTLLQQSVVLVLVLTLSVTQIRSFPQYLTSDPYGGGFNNGINNGGYYRGGLGGGGLGGGGLGGYGGGYNSQLGLNGGLAGGLGGGLGGGGIGLGGLGGGFGNRGYGYYSDASSMRIPSRSNKWYWNSLLTLAAMGMLTLLC
ncbi:hypothetical protein PCASD_07620 [Puccinia coronata f. sp. avenae]|uniref:Uncharacterized protein n=1 Tax=Puccinia coronata f. sp. avenae TaxID=200324 RepID=A0A2N5UN11_9BASI|nr:hypothetical protein PCASD_07620 [Puccinia coronata f. sp. avenae]